MLKYSLSDGIADSKAGFITAIVALPLAIAFAIASGVPAVMGMYTAIIAGVLAALFGGAKYSITGPTGAMTVIILATVGKFGIDGLLVAGLLAGLLQILFGLLRIGKAVKYVPFPVITGFTAGIGAIIFIGQIANFLGLSVASHEHVWETFFDIVKQLNSIDGIAVGVALATIIMLLLLPKVLVKSKYTKNIPASIIALVLSVGAVIVFALAIPQVGVIPHSLPSFHIPKISVQLIRDVLPASFTIALLGAIEAVLCAVVADAMTGTRHKTNKELVGQGIANVVLPFFGGIPSTAAIARTAVNIREGAKTRLAAVYHSLILLCVLLFLGPVAKYIPKAFLAGVLMVVSVKMINISEIKTILHVSKADVLVLVITFFLTVFTDLVFAVQVGMLLAIFLLFVRMVQITDISSMEQYDKESGINATITADPLLKDKVAVYTVHGPFFFGAMNTFENKLQNYLQLEQPFIVLRLKHVPFMDSTGVENLKSFIGGRQGRQVLLSGVKPKVKKVLLAHKQLKELFVQGKVFDKTSYALEYCKKVFAQQHSAQAQQIIDKVIPPAG